MHIKTRNVNTAFKEIVGGIHSGSIPVTSTSSRNGGVLAVEEPVIITYSHPKERVLFNSVRDANPFFHVMESLWMLAGRNDVAPLSYYSSTIAKIASDDGKTFNGAYGYRWRHADTSGQTYYAKTDQLDVIVNHLKSQPNSRRAVLQMWNVEDDLLKIGQPCLNSQHAAEDKGALFFVQCQDCNGTRILGQSRDVCCNLSVLFAVRSGTCPNCGGTGEVAGGGNGWAHDTAYPCDKCGGKPHDQPRYLDMTVFNRSNDLIWGCLGANAVHFSVLQEYMALNLGMEVGVYNQISNNLHVYENNWKPAEWLAYYENANRVEYTPPMKTVQLISDPDKFEKELPLFVEEYAGGMRTIKQGHQYQEPFLLGVVEPVMLAWRSYKDGTLSEALERCEEIKADDWRAACTEWIERRIERRKK